MAVWGCIGLFALTSAESRGTAMVTEPETGVSFPATRRWGSYRQVAVGLAMKKKVFFRVYAACLYIDSQAGKDELLQLAKGSGTYEGGRINKPKLQQQEALYRWLVHSDLAMTIDLTFVRSFAYEDFKRNLGEKLGLYLKDQALIERFLGLPSGDIEAFGHLTFNLLPRGKVVLQYMGKTFKPIASKALRQAVLRTFFGDREENREIRRGLVQDIDRLLR